MNKSVVALIYKRTGAMMADMHPTPVLKAMPSVFSELRVDGVSSKLDTIYGRKTASTNRTIATVGRSAQRTPSCCVPVFRMISYHQFCGSVLVLMCWFHVNLHHESLPGLLRHPRPFHVPPTTSSSLEPSRTIQKCGVTVIKSAWILD